MKKQWISVKCGLVRDPKHRQKMGESIWLFLHILDTASWEDGIAHDWKDEAEAEEMGMPVRTLREHRRRLSELGYITCNQKQYTQDVVIHNWTNPREYSGQVYNQKQGDTEMEPQGDTQGDIQGSSKDVTPTSNSNNQISVGDLEKPKTKDLIDGLLDLSNAPGVKREARVNSILSYIGGRFQINTETNAWRKFARNADTSQQEHGQSVSVFFDWLVSQKGFDLAYWPPSKMWEHWPRAFDKPMRVVEKREMSSLEKFLAKENNHAL
jgi:hypothetical protein